MRWSVMDLDLGNITPMQTPWIDSMRNPLAYPSSHMEPTSVTSLGRSLNER